MIKIFNVHATWQTKGGRKGELSRSYVGNSIEDVQAKVRSHLHADRRFSAVRALDITVRAPEPQHV
jgi:hypothetical protein